MDKKTCDTIGCRSAATHVLTTPGLDPGGESEYADDVCLPCGQGYLRRPALRATLAPKPESPQSGCSPCACRDCMDTAVSADMTKPDLCTECTDAGCSPWRDGEELKALDGRFYECQRDDAYSVAEPEA
jgi:hypothetical protein